MCGRLCGPCLFFKICAILVLWCYMWAVAKLFLGVGCNHQVYCDFSLMGQFSEKFGNKFHGLKEQRSSEISEVFL